ncbi:hypothetical protein TrRE_jg3746, partial [Triparma retinervis]
MSERTPLNATYKDPSALAHLSRLKNYQKYVFFITFGSYFMSHFSRKCYSTVKKQLIDEGGYSSVTLSEMDTTFMATYAIGSFVSGRLGDIYRPTTILAIGLYGSGICLFFMLANLLMDYEHMSKLLGDSIMLGTYFLFGFAQSTGGPVGTAIMGNWFCDADSIKNRGTIFGLWTCHQYLGDICAAVCTAAILHFGVNWLWALVLPAICNVAWGALCITLTPDPAEMGIQVDALTKPKDPTSAPLPTHSTSAAAPSAAISFFDALMIPNVLAYAVAFGFFKLINYVLFFWLPFFLNTHFDSVTANLIAALYSLGMMPGGIIVGKVSDIFGGRRATVIAVFMLFLVPCLLVFATAQDDLPPLVLFSMLCLMGILVGGPNNIITSAVAADLADHPSIAGSKKALGTVTGIINGSGSITASIGLLAIGPLQKSYGWSSVWYFLVGCTVVGTALMGPKIRREM